MKLWGDQQLNPVVERFTVGEDYLLDRELVPYDCLGSIAHARMVGKIGLLTTDEVAALVAELEAIAREAAAGRFVIHPEQEDCHTAIEQTLTARLGEVGRKIHVGRSRNDQVLTALRLYCRERVAEARAGVAALVRTVRSFARRHRRVPMPGFTHTRKAMPSGVALWAGALADSLADDLLLLEAVARLLDQCPLGSGAGYGSPLPLDRQMTAAELGFARVQNNPIYAQNSRGKFEAAMLGALAQVALDLNRAATDIIWFSLPDLGYFKLPTELTTGSSIMPQKRNPDPLELVRGSYHLLLGCKLQLETQMANQIHGYHRDLQLTKGPTMRGLKCALEVIAVMDLLFASLEVDRGACRRAMTSELYATERACELVTRLGLPFRDAYLQVKRELERT